jgi:hypothetical protein
MNSDFTKENVLSSVTNNKLNVPNHSYKGPQQLLKNFPAAGSTTSSSTPAPSNSTPVTTPEHSTQLHDAAPSRVTFKQVDYMMSKYSPEVSEHKPAPAPGTAEYYNNLKHEPIHPHSYKKYPSGIQEYPNGGFKVGDVVYDRAGNRIEEPEKPGDIISKGIRDWNREIAQGNYIPKAYEDMNLWEKIQYAWHKANPPKPATPKHNPWEIRHDYSYGL